MHISAAGYVETSALYSNIVVPQAFELAAKAALGILNEKPLGKKIKKITHNSSDSIKHKTNIKKELKGRAKNCSIMWLGIITMIERIYLALNIRIYYFFTRENKNC